MRLVAKDKQGRLESQTDVQGHYSNRYVWKFGKMLHVAWDDFGQKFTHIHCKAKNCDNNWKEKSGSAPSNQFVVERTTGNIWRITCKGCGMVYESG